MFLEPDRHTVTVYEISEATERYLRDIAYVFAHVDPRTDQELIRFAYDAVNQWKTSLPEASRRSVRLSDEANILLRQIYEVTNPAELLLHNLPATFGRGRNGRSYEETIAVVERVRNEIDSLIEGYVDVAVGIIGETLTVNSDADMLHGVRSWVRCLDVENLLKRGDLRTHR